VRENPRPGGCLFDAPREIPAIWGKAEEVLWAQGEPLALVGGDGVGKTTLAQRLIRGRCGLEDEVLGFAVAPEERKVLYVAADRPRQAHRSLRRMIELADRDTLDDKLLIWDGPLVKDVGLVPETLVRLAVEHDAGTLVIDSLKDIAVDLSGDDTGSRVARACQLVIAEGVEVLLLHHQRKQSAGGGQPRSISDVYGSRWITAMCGSVVMLCGEPGDAVVRLLHLKQPGEPVGPLSFRHDHPTGRVTVERGLDLVVLVERSPSGVTAREVAEQMFGTASPPRNEIEKARRDLDKLVEKMLIRKDPGVAGGVGGGTSTRYVGLT
jgi:replicative DNA helicase